MTLLSSHLRGVLGTRVGMTVQHYLTATILPCHFMPLRHSPQPCDKFLRFVVALSV